MVCSIPPPDSSSGGGGGGDDGASPAPNHGAARVNSGSGSGNRRVGSARGPRPASQGGRAALPPIAGARQVIGSAIGRQTSTTPPNSGSFDV
jgi:hypothetical protein